MGSMVIETASPLAKVSTLPWAMGKSFAFVRMRPSESLVPAGTRTLSVQVRLHKMYPTPAPATKSRNPKSSFFFIVALFSANPHQPQTTLASVEPVYNLKPMDDVVQGGSSQSACAESLLIAKRAACLVWLVGSVELLVGTAAAGIFLAASRMPLPEVMAWSGQPIGLGELALAQDRFLSVAIVFVVLGTVPGLGYLILGFSVRWGRSRPIVLALLMAVTQSVALAIGLVGATVHAIRLDQPPMLTINAFILGSPIVFLIYMAKHLMLAKNVGPLAPDGTTEK